jgi:hypothetical protein
MVCREMDQGPAGLAGVLLTWLYSPRPDGQTVVADAALLLGLNPIYWDFSHQAMAGRRSP